MIRESSELFVEQIADLTPVVISVFDLVTERDVYTSREVETLTDYTSEEIARMDDPISALWHPDDLPRYRDMQARTKTLAEGEIFELEYRIRRRDGQWRWLASRIMPFLRNDRGELRQIVTATVDITERKQACQALSASEKRFRRIFELGLIGIAITSPEKSCIEVNDEICKILGYERSELLEKTWAELTHPEDLAAEVANFNRVLAGEFDGYSMDKRWIRKDGQVIYSAISVKCVRREDGAIDQFVAFLQDITARKQAEEALATSHLEMERRVAERTAELTQEIAERKRAQEKLRRSEAYLSETQKISRVGSWAWNASSGEIFWSAENFRIFGLDTEKFHPTGETILAIIHPGDRSAISDSFSKSTSEKSNFYDDFRIVLPNGLIRHVRAVGHPVTNASGELIEFVGALMDVTERKRSEAALRRSQEELQVLTTRLMEAQEAESKYLARELHDDFSQKLAVLGMEMAALARRTDACCEELGVRLLEFTAQIGTLAKDIHRISRQLHPAILDDLGLVAALKSECVAFAEQHRVSTDFDPGCIPPAVPDDIALCLYRVAQESLRNVAKHAKAASVRVALSGTQDEIAMEVADTGDGFDLRGIKGKGGLGLISMEERLRLVNGTFVIRSQPGKGTLVSARVPLRSKES